MDQFVGLENLALTQKTDTAYLHKHFLLPANCQARRWRGDELGLICSQDLGTLESLNHVWNPLSNFR